ncbi:ABC transporter permease [Spirochaeta dissipatitropha]
MTEHRNFTSNKAFIPLIAVCILIPLIFAVSSDQPAAAVRAFFLGPFSSIYAFGNLLSQSALLLLSGLGAVLAFQTGSFNLGGEGQVYAGSAVAVALALFLGPGSLPGWLIIAVVCIGGGSAGAGIAGLSAYSRKRWNADELITSFLIGSAMFPLVDYLFRELLYDSSSSMIRTPYIAEKVRFTQILQPSVLSAAALLALLIWLISTLYMEKGVRGTRYRLTGNHPEFAAAEGLQIRSIRSSAFTISGALHGIAGALLVTGVHHAGILGFSAGYGWNGIAIALIAGNRPLKLLPAALFFSYIIAGSRQALVVSNLRLDISSILQAMIFLLVTVQATRRRKEK